MRDGILALHIATGSFGLILGPIAMLAPKRRGRHTRAGTVYHFNMLAVCVSAAAMAIIDFRRIWWFLRKHRHRRRHNGRPHNRSPQPLRRRC